MKLVKLDLTIKEQEISIEEDTEIVGYFLGYGNSHLSTSIKVIHTRPELKSLTRIKAVVFDNSVFDMSGTLIINKGAKNTDAYLRLDALMMSRNSKARVVPGLEIFESDVKGGHGATVGRVNIEQLIYLKSRGLTQEKAEELIVAGFLKDIVNKFNDSKP